MRLQGVPKTFSVLAIAVFSSGCIRSMATGALADSLSGTGGVYASDDDPELIEGAIPFGLKTMEGVLVEQPKHRGLLTALASGFVSYGAAFVNMPADRLETRNLGRAREMRARARKLFLRARGYGFRGLEVAHPDFTAKLGREPDATLAATDRDDVPLLYWTAAAWGLTIASDKTDTALIADLPIVQKIADRVLALDPRWGNGAVYELMISLESTRPSGSTKRAREYFLKAVELSGGKRVSPFVGYAEAVCVKEQRYQEFKQLLERALAIDLEKSPNDKLVNTIMQRRARWLLSRAPDLFLDTESEGTATSTLSRGD